MNFPSLFKSVRLIGFVAVLGILLLIAVFFAAKQFKPAYVFNTSSQTVIKQLESLNRLETASFTIEKVIDAKTEGGQIKQFFFGDRLLLIAQGQVIAGIDLSKVHEGDITVTGTSLSLTLPSPEIFVVNLYSDQTRVYDRRQGLLTKGDPQLESQARSVAEKTIRQAACEGKILDEANKNAKNQLESLFKTAGFSEVGIRTSSGSC